MVNPNSRTCLSGLGLGAIGALMFALVARKETRELLRERSSKTLD